MNKSEESNDIEWWTSTSRQKVKNTPNALLEQEGAPLTSHAPSDFLYTDVCEFMD